ncbi:MAG: sigma-70 family RNA polymerase sigma factor [Thermomicrobiales bacterium]
MDVSALVVKARAGDVDAFTELVRVYQAMAFGYAYSSLGDFHLAEDAVQQAFITAYRNLRRLRQPERFPAWLRGIVRFECSHLRRKHRVSTVSLDLAGNVASSIAGPAQLAEEREAFKRVLTAIKALPDGEREATILFYVHEYAQRDVAAFLNLPVTTVNNRLRAARKRLKEGDLLAMARVAFSEHGLPEDFATRVGEIIRADGPIIDARFARESRPPILNALTIEDESTGLTYTAEVAQYLDDDLVRSIAVGAGDAAQATARAGMRIVDTNAPIHVPLDVAAIAHLIASIRGDARPTGVLETGIEAIDLLCPFPAGGVIGIAGDMQTGKMVLVEELIHRFGDGPHPLSILVFVEAPAEVSVIQQVAYRTSASVEAIYLPVASTSPQALQEATRHLDAVVTLARRLAEQSLYPAIDPTRSTSRLLEPAVVGQPHVEIARVVRKSLADSPHSRVDDSTRVETSTQARAVCLQRYLTQPFFVAEAFTNRPGAFVTRAATIADCGAILAGAYDDLPEDAFFMIGTLDAAVGEGRS